MGLSAMYPSKTAPERYADGIVHAVSLVGLLIAFAFLLPRAAANANPDALAATLVYTIAVLLSVGMSFAYHLLPFHDWRPTMRKWDHAAIYPVIAGTFTPLLIIAETWTAHAILAVVWLFALIGIVFKIVGTNMDSRWSLISYLGLGWFGLLALPDFLQHLPGISTAAIGVGGVFYTIGALFYRNKSMRFRYPIWHTFGTMGGTSFLVAIWIALGG